MARRINRLTALQVKIARPGWHNDGNGLYLQVSESALGGANRNWVFRFTSNGRERRMGLGPLHDVGLAAARDLADAARRLHRQGSDPIDARKALRRRGASEGVTFRTAFDDYFALKAPQLSNAKHREQWRSTMAAYVFPAIGARPVDDIMPGEIIDLLRPIWHVTPETARRVLQRVGAVFTSAITRQVRTRANPCIGVAAELGDNRNGGPNHMRALPYAELPAFLAQLREARAWSSTRLCLEWLILTAARSGEARGATWGEVDEGRALWTIPAARRKSRKPLAVPLAPRCIEILTGLRAVSNTRAHDLLFPSNREGRPLSDMTLTGVLRDMSLDDRATVHGFRSSFKDWCATVARVRDEVSEAALGHVDKNEVRAAYLRTDYLDERRGVMDAWANWCLVLR